MTRFHPSRDCAPAAAGGLRAIFLAASLLAAGTASGQVSFPLTSFEQYLRVDPADVASPPLIVVLADHGFAPGQVIRIESLGGFDNGPEGDAPRALMAVFSASATILAPSLTVRVPDAIDAGTDYVTHATCPGNYPTDIPQDFTVPIEGVSVEIPAGATHLFLCPRECYSRDNSDPNADFGARLSVAAAAAPETSAPGLSLRPPRPSPMTGRCAIGFTLPAGGRVRLELYGVDGRRIRSLLDGPLPAGTHDVSWDGRDERGMPAANGLYFARLATSVGTCSRRLIVAR